MSDQQKQKIAVFPKIIKRILNLLKNNFLFNGLVTPGQGQDPDLQNHHPQTPPVGPVAHEK